MGARRPRKEETEVDALTKGTGLSLNAYQVLEQGFAEMKPEMRQGLIDDLLKLVQARIDIVNKYHEYVMKTPRAMERIRWGQSMDGLADILAMAYSLMKVQKTHFSAALTTSDMEKVKELLEGHQERERQLSAMAEQIREQLALPGGGDVIDAEEVEVVEDNA